MNKLICVLGWEERFIEGLEKTLQSQQIDTIDLIIYSDYTSYTEANKHKLTLLCNKFNTELIEHLIIYTDPVKSWKQTKAWIQESILADDQIWLDISTMPRETIWTVLFFLRPVTQLISYIYWPPKTYDSEWLCKEPGRPRLLFKHSGITDLDKPTALLVLTGFDAERTHQLIDYFEPKLTVLGIQTGNQYENDLRNAVEKHYEQGRGETELQTFNIDVYNADMGLETLRQQVIPLLESYNLLISSLGPKLSSLSIYQLICEFDEIALVYVPTKLYNTIYSKGIKDGFSGHLRFPVSV